MEAGGEGKGGTRKQSGGGGSLIPELWDLSNSQHIKVKQSRSQGVPWGNH